MVGRHFDAIDSVPSHALAILLIGNDESSTHAAELTLGIAAAHFLTNFIFSLYKKTSIYDQDHNEIMRCPQQNSP